MSPHRAGRPIRRVAVVTGTRAEFGILAPVARALQQHARLELQLIVTGMHLLKRFGATIDQIRSAGWPIAATVRMQSGRDDPSEAPNAVAKGIAGMARAFERLDSDAVLVTGDRIEAFAGATAASVGQRLLVHLHGGDRALGITDDMLRNAITRLAHVHLVASRDAARRLKRMGECGRRIHRVGAPGLDEIHPLRRRIRADRAGSEARLRTLLGDLDGAPYALIVQHPLGRAARIERSVMERIFKAVRTCKLAGVVICPNSDPGHEGIFQAIERIEGRAGWRVFRSLAREDYLRVAMGSAVLAGNSSSGIIESASLGIHAVNIGPRQSGRLRCGPGVVDCDESAPAITSAVRKALARRRPAATRSVYGDGRASKRIADVLERLIISPELLAKELTY